MDIDALLEEWGFEEYIAIFKENEIDDEAFAALDDKMIAELIPKVGPRAKFLNKFKLYKSNLPLIIIMEVQNDNKCTASTGTSPTDQSGGQSIINASFSSDMGKRSDQSEDQSIINVSSSSDMVFPKMESTLEFTEEEIQKTPSKLHITECLRKTNLEQILNSTNQGKSILNYFKINKELDRTTRDKLVELIIEHETKDNIDKRITTQQFEAYANAIEELFSPTEHANIYFFYTSYKNQKVGSGKLFRKFYNYRRSLKKCGMLKLNDQEKFDKKETEQNVGLEESQELLWLRNSSAPWRAVKAYWRNTFQIRYEILRNETATGPSLSEYINTFPALKSNLGYTLLESDYEQLYPGTSMKMFSNSWKVFSDRIITKALTIKDKQIRTQLLKINNAGDEDEKFVRTILLLPFLLPTHTLKRKKEVGYWRPSRIEVAEGFLLHIKTIDDLYIHIEAKREKLKRFGLTLQPTPIIVGPNLGEIDSAYIFVDGHLFIFEKAIKAIDTCFKIIHSLHALYPLESEAVWLLLQKAVYKITSPRDKNLISVNVMLQELGY